MSDMIDNSEFERCINASDLIDWIIETCPDWCEGAIRTIVDHIDEMPSAQPEIVRCKECKYYHPYYCEAWSKFGIIQTKENGYCYMAERWEE